MTHSGNQIARLTMAFVAATAVSLAVVPKAHAQKSELQPVVKKIQTPPPSAPATPAPSVLAAPARFTAEPTSTGVQLHWATVPNTYEYWIYRVAGPSAPDTGLIGNLPAANIPATRDGAFFDAHHITAEYRIRAVDRNNKRGNPARVSYTAPAATKP